jgi:hypothetical protein
LRGYRKPFVRERRPAGGWEIVSSHVTSERWPITVRARKGHIHPATLTELCCGTFLAGRAYGACEYLIGRAQQLCAQVGADLVVFTIPDQLQLSRDGHEYLKSLRPELEQFDAELPDRHIASICRSIDVAFVAGKEFLGLNCYKTNDCHWNELGHRKVGAKLAELHASRKSGIARAADLAGQAMTSTRKLQATAKAAT